ncbi:MAG: hypothetical protein AB8W37_01855 [Arsenophonus endosymbiont of Dermacentor nuttalli]
MDKSKHILELNIAEPESIVFRNRELLDDTECKLYHHTFGQLIYVVKGIIEMQVAS